MMKNETIQTSLPGLETEEEIEGVVERIVFTNEASPFTVFSFKPLRKKSRITALANVEAPLVGQQLRLRGHWTQHKRYGQQFQVTGLRIEAPSSAEGIERFLASGVVDGIGPSLAKRIVQKFGKKTLTVIEQTPHRLSEVAGIGKKTIEKITASYTSQSELRDIMLWLETHHISGTYAARIFKKYGSFSIDTLENHPYQLAREVEGIGFIIADSIAKSLGIAAEDRSRISAGIDFALQKIAQQGHCCIPEAALEKQAADLLKVEQETVRKVLKDLLQAKQLAVEYVGAETLIYPPFLDTLPPQQFLSGFAEMLKTGLIASSPSERGSEGALWYRLLQYDLDTMDTAALAPLIRDCIAVKERIVAADPDEQGPRKALNLGHTFGHALEEMSFVHRTSSLGSLLHGYAVLYGLIAELYLSVTLLGCPHEPLQQLTLLMLRYYGRPVCKCSDRRQLITLMQQDKKNEHAAEINCTLLHAIGAPAINQTVTPAQAGEALEYLFSL